MVANRERRYRTEKILLSQRLHLITGKGGVGKSVISISLILKDYLLRLRYNLDGIFINRLCLSCNNGEGCNLQNLPAHKAEGLINSVSDDRLRESIQRHFIRGIDARREILKKFKDFLDKYQNDLNLFEVPGMTGYIRSTQDILELYRGIRRLVKR